MTFDFERSQLVAAQLRAAFRHHDRGIPMQNAARTAKRKEAATFVF
jgi:hypothetical protein